MKRYREAIIKYCLQKLEYGDKIDVKYSRTSSSAYITLRFADGGSEIIRVSDHLQPEDGAYDPRRGYRMSRHTTEYLYRRDSLAFVRQDLDEIFCPTLN